MRNPTINPIHKFEIPWGFYTRAVPRSLGCIFLFSGIFFWTKKPVPARIPEDFFFSCIFWRNFSQERGLGGGLRNSCFLLLSQVIFAGIPAGQEFLHLQRIPRDSSGFLRIPVPTKCCLALASNKSRLSVM
jgi:hypothetical protein